MNKKRILKFIGLKTLETTSLILIIIISHNFGKWFHCSYKFFMIEDMCKGNTFLNYIQQSLLGFLSLIVVMIVLFFFIILLWSLIKINWEWSK